MSQDRFTANDDATPAAAGRRCSLAHAREARLNYCGTVRPPRYEDERGALVVVDLVFSDGARRAFFPLQGIDQCSVVDLPAVPRPLICDKCGTAAEDEARLGGTHYRFVEHGVGIPGRKPTRQARKCGTWVAKGGQA